MNEKIEKTFVETFIIKSLQERLLFELLGKKRNKALTRLSHNIKGIFECKHMKQIIDKKELLDMIDEQGFNSNKVYVIGGQFDGKELPCLEAIQNAFQQSDAMVLIFSSSFAFIKEESEGGYSEKYILTL